VVSRFRWPIWLGRLDPSSGKIDLKHAPTQNSHPYGIAINSKGVPIFCEFATNKMASINPQTMEIKEYVLPEGARPRRMAIDASDRVYFTDFSGGHLGRLDLGSGAVKMWESLAARNQLRMASRLRLTEWFGTASLG